jgi:hypothetical protein
MGDGQRVARDAVPRGSPSAQLVAPARPLVFPRVTGRTDRR